MIVSGNPPEGQVFPASIYNIYIIYMVEYPKKGSKSNGKAIQRHSKDGNLNGGAATVYDHSFALVSCGQSEANSVASCC